MRACTGLTIRIVLWSRGRSPGGRAGAPMRTGTASVPNPVLKVAAGRDSYAAAVTGPGAHNFNSGGNHSSCTLDGTSEHTSRHCTKGAGIYSPARCGSSGDVLCPPTRGVPNSAGASSPSQAHLTVLACPCRGTAHLSGLSPAR
uniref:Uncharacterized protein n=1 Tax=Hyaloperonospora arabidopsidis (strain Emoy2) TaxID=559515 RepID=M4BB75_HYAAE